MSCEPRLTIPKFCALVIVIALSMVLAPGTFSVNAQQSLEIWEIQGTSSVSPYEFETVTTSENIVTAVGVNGFFIQTPPDRSDNDPLTSDGILVYTARRPTVQRGDRVTVTGEITEYYGMTEFADRGLEYEVTGAGEPPEPVVLEAPFPPEENTIPDAFERYEGMLVQVDGAVANGPAVRYYAGQPREEYEIPVTYGYDRAYREPGIDYPAEGEEPHIEVFDGNSQVFEFGFGGGANSDDFAPLEVNVNTGATLSAIGPINYRFDRYQLWPLAGTLTIDTSTAMVLPRPVQTPQPGEYTIGTQNAYNLFDMVDDRGKDDTYDTPWEVSEYQHQLDRLAAQICEVLQAPDIIALQEVEKIEALDHPDPGEPDLVSAISDACGVVYTAYLIEGNDGRGIDNGFLVRDTVQVLEHYQIGQEEMFRPTIGTGPEALFDRPPLVMEVVLDPDGTAFPIMLINVHLKSYLDSEYIRYRELRFQQAIFLAQYIQSLQETTPALNLIVLGDFNAYQFNDGMSPSVQVIAGSITAIGSDNSLASWWPEKDYVEPDLVIQTTERLSEAERYSYVYDGSAQTLDHILTSQALDRYITRVEYGRGNADASFGYAELAGSPLKSSDHDGAVIALQIEGYTSPEITLTDPEITGEQPSSAGQPTGSAFPLTLILLGALVVLACGAYLLLRPHKKAG
nr:endonuclease/exonuclease/phosphatase family protein [Anaerolineae bacterium]